MRKICKLKDYIAVSLAPGMLKVREKEHFIAFFTSPRRLDDDDGVSMFHRTAEIEFQDKHK
jgi:hypothetical protein